MRQKYDISVVMGSKNRKRLIRATIDSIRHNGFHGNIEIIVVDGGSTDGTCDWLATQKDIFTIVQPNYSVISSKGFLAKVHSWGEFMNIGFKYCHSDYICMVSDDLILAPGCLQQGYEEIKRRIENGEKIGGGAFYFREFPRHDYYRVIKLPKGYININHGFYYVPALKEVGWLDETSYNFYRADGDVAMRLNLAGWKTIVLEGCFAAHLVHLPSKHKKQPLWYINDKKTFASKYPYESLGDIQQKRVSPYIKTSSFYRYALKNVIVGYMLKFYDKWYNDEGTKNN